MASRGSVVLISMGVRSSFDLSRRDLWYRRIAKPAIHIGDSFAIFDSCTNDTVILAALTMHRRNLMSCVIYHTENSFLCARFCVVKSTLTIP